MSNVRHRLRAIYQRCFTRLPFRLRRFDELFPAHCDYARGIRPGRPLHTGVLHHESGQPFLIGPAGGLTGSHAELASATSRYWCREPDRIVYALAGAGVHGAHGWVYDPVSRAFVTETCEDWDHPVRHHPALASPGFPAPARLPGISLMLGGLGGQTFYHFFVETLPKLRVLAPLLPSVDHILVTRFGESWKRRWLSLWGLEDKIVFIDELSHLVCDQLLFTNRFVRHFEPGPWCVETLRHMPGLPPVAPAVNPRGPVLWLDRTRQTVRPVAWEKDLLAALPPWIEPVRTEDLDPRQTAGRFGSARAIAGFHGAAFSNLVFCPPGARVLEIFTEPKEPWYARLAQSAGHDHSAAVVPDHADSIATLLTLLAKLQPASSP